MGSQLDIIGSVIIAGMIILNFTVFMGERQDSQIESTNKVTAQTDMNDVTTILRHDLRKIGYGCDTLPIIRATESLLAFRADLDNNGKLDTVVYAFSKDLTGTTTSTSTSSLTSSTITDVNEDQLVLPKLYRIVNGRKNHGQSVNLIGFRFKYFTTSTSKYGALEATTVEGDIRAIGVTLRMRSTMKEEGKYAFSLNEFVVTPRNL